MLRLALILGVFLVPLALLSAAPAAPIQQREADYQQQMFKRWWGTELVRKLDDLPTEGSVPEFRIPYSGHDYPDQAGGVAAPQGGGLSALHKYDLAFHGGRPVVVEWEKRDIDHRPAMDGRGLIAAIARRRWLRQNEGWFGHCNGWTGAAMRHAEPQRSVVRNGVTFTPADIKGLLAEIYMYSETEHLGGVDPACNPGTLHITLTNWIGRGSHPVGMEVAVGEPVFNYPAYAYEATIVRRSARQAEVKMNVTYAQSSNYEADKSPRLARQMYFHYLLDLDAEGNIVGGSYFGDSNQIDMLWAQLQPKQGGEKGNERGCPHISVKEVLSIWRESVPAEIRNKWMNIDPTPEDAILPPQEADDVPLAEADDASSEGASDAMETGENGEAAEAGVEAAAPEADAADVSEETRRLRIFRRRDAGNETAPAIID